MLIIVVGGDRLIDGMVLGKAVCQTIGALVPEKKITLAYMILVLDQ